MSTSTSSETAAVVRRCREEDIGQRPEGVPAMALVGGSMLALGLGQRSWLGAGLMIGGAALLYRSWNLSTRSAPDRGVGAQRGCKIETTLFVNRPREELYRYWRDLSNLPSVMSHLSSVKERGDNLSHWVAEGPFGLRAEWDAQIINERAPDVIAWESVNGSMVATAGSVHFSDSADGKGTHLRVSLNYDPPGGWMGATLAEWLGSGLEQQVQEDLRRFKQFMETGEVPTTAGQPQGAKS